mgnify:CR=1 FL=1
MFNQKISVVSYLNAKPFIYGLMHAPNGSHFNFCLDIPAVCAAKLATNEVQVGLIPVAAMLDMQNPQIITDYCISAHEAVNSVFIFANNSIDEIHTIYLDPHSRSSNNLAKILLKYFWKKEVEFKERTIDIVSLKDGEAFVLIGDRTFGIQVQYQHVYDLATAWFNFTELPFVFAAWVANTLLTADFIKEFNAVLNNVLFGFKKNASSTQKTIDNWRTEISALFAFIQEEDNHLQPSKMAIRLANNQYLDEFFNYFL